jgi:hypothetical protein
MNDVLQAKERYEKSVQLDGFPRALVHLGLLLHEGTGGTAKDHQEAFR